MLALGMGSFGKTKYIAEKPFVEERVSHHR